MAQKEVKHQGAISLVILRKRVKRFTLRFTPLDGKFTLTVMPETTDEQIDRFLHENRKWIDERYLEFKQTERKGPIPFYDGATHYLWGVPYSLSVLHDDTKAKIDSLGDNRFQMTVPHDYSFEQRSKLFDMLYRMQMREKLTFAQLASSMKTGLNTHDIVIRRMKTRWGSCNPQSRRITLNLALAEWPVQCLSYVLTHELLHIKVPNHGPNFIQLMDKHEPRWREIDAFMSKPMGTLPIPFKSNAANQ